MRSFSDNFAEDIPEAGDVPATLPDGSESVSEEDSDDDVLVQNLGTVLIVDDAAYEYYTFSRSTADKYAAVINGVSAQLKGKARVFDMIVPTSIDIVLKPSVRKGLNSSEQKKAINYIYSVISPDTVNHYI